MIAGLNTKKKTLFKSLTEKINKMENKMEKTKPTENFREGNVTAAIFEQTFESKNGTYINKNVQLQIGYKKKDSDEWKNSKISIAQRDLEKAINVLQLALTSIQGGKN